jgi:hypothetical protein
MGLATHGFSFLRPVRKFRRSSSVAGVAGVLFAAIRGRGNA